MKLENALRILFRLCLFTITIVGAGYITRLFFENYFIAGVITGYFASILLDLDLKIELLVFGKRISL